MNQAKTAHMDRMSVIDTVWLLGDDQRPGEPRIPAQVGVLGLFRGEPPSYEQFVSRFIAGFERVPRMRHRVRRTPFDALRPLWVDDVDFDIARHVQIAEYPGDVTYEGLREFLETLAYTPLDRAHPLWKCWLVPKLDDGRWGLVFAMHHAAADGLGIIELQPTFMDPAPGAVSPEPEADAATETAWSPSPTPGSREMLRKMVADVVALLTAPITALRRAASNPTRSRGRLATRARHALVLARSRPESLKCEPLSVLSGKRSGPPTNGVLKLPLTELLAAKRRLGGTVTAVYLAGLALGLRRWLNRRGVDTASLSLRVALPISFRADAARELGNEVGGMWITLPMWEMTTARRVELISESIAEQQAVAEAGWELLRFVNLVPAFLMRGVMERTSRPTMFNFAASAVRGPEKPHYMFGSQLEEVLSAGFLPPHNLFAIAMSSYNESVRCFLMADREAIHDHDQLNDDLARGFAALLDECDCDGTTVTQGAEALGLSVDDQELGDGRSALQQVSR